MYQQEILFFILYFFVFSFMFSSVYCHQQSSAWFSSPNSENFQCGVRATERSMTDLDIKFEYQHFCECAGALKESYTSTRFQKSLANYQQIRWLLKCFLNEILISRTCENIEFFIFCKTTESFHSHYFFNFVMQI